MKTLLAVISLAALGGCVVAPPGPAYYGSRAPQGAYNPYEWHTVSSEPVQSGRVMSAPRVEYTNEPVYVQQQPVYIQQPVYVPAPVYAPQPYYYNPPVSIGLDFMFGFGRYGGHRGGWGGHGRYHGRR
jgi:hypothetical protein